MCHLDARLVRNDPRLPALIARLASAISHFYYITRTDASNGECTLAARMERVMNLLAMESSL
ncbi:hypothetical protein KCP74_12400 [Salmonella enterica subsp. enterica]|nr:hypothetical protein KCP74_12400 [Salmonella enterica subsp. enterica]